MPTDFTDFIRSLRNDGKLILSNAIKAAAGKKVVLDVRDSANAVEMDLENEVGVLATVSIPKGAAIDAIAREAATAAQTDIDEHEANHPSGGGSGDDAAAWAEEGNTDLIPAAKFRAPTATARGGVAGATNDVIDNETGGTWLAWTVSNVRRLTRRLVSNWAYAGNTDLIPDAKTGVTGAVNTHDSDLGSHASAQRVLNQDPNADADTLGKLQIDPQGNAYTTEPDTEHGTAQSRGLRQVHPRRLHRGAERRAQPAGANAGKLLLPDRGPQAPGDGQQLLRSTPVGGCRLV